MNIPKDKLDLPNKEIKDWLFSRDWLYHYAGDGKTRSIKFSAFNEGAWVGNSKIIYEEITLFPLEGASYVPATLCEGHSPPIKEVMVHLQICKSCTIKFSYDIIIHFAYVKSLGYERVFSGYINSLEELKIIFTLVGLAEKQLL